MTSRTGRGRARKAASDIRRRENAAQAHQQADREEIAANRRLTRCKRAILRPLDNVSRAASSRRAIYGACPEPSCVLAARPGRNFNLSVRGRGWYVRDSPKPGKSKALGHHPLRSSIWLAAAT